MGWFASRKTVEPETSALKLAQEFMATYARSGKKTHYAMYLWGISVAFHKIFGSLDEFQIAAPEKKNRYIMMLGQLAIDDVQQDKIIKSDCSSLFMNFLVATNGIRRRDLRGSIEQIADMLDGIVRLGSAENERIARVADEAAEFLRSERSFQVGSGRVKGPVTDRVVAEVAQIMQTDLGNLLKTQQDIYWFVVEQHDLLVAQRAAIRNLLDGFPLFPIEHTGMRSEESFIGAPNPGVAYVAGLHDQVRIWCAATAPNLNAEELSTRVICVAFASFRAATQPYVDLLRAHTASHYRDNCLNIGNQEAADRWDAVVKSLA